MATICDLEKKKCTKSTFVSSILQSPFLWLLLLLPLIDMGCRFIKPLQFVTVKSYRPVEFDSWVSKFPPYLDSKAKPDVLVVGSSLPMAAFALADKKFDLPANSADQDTLRTYTAAEEFQKGMSAVLDQNNKVENFSCAGGMVSDTYIFLKRLIDEGRIPRMVLYGIAPRDFADNLMPTLGQSPLFEVVSDWSFDLPKAGMTAKEYVDYSLARYSYHYKTRRKQKNVLTALTADSLGRPINLFTASSNKAEAADINVTTPGEAKAACSQPVKTNALEADLAVYQKRYNPVNNKRFESEKEYLEKLVQLCQNNHIPLVFIRMPLTKENFQLIPNQLCLAYNEALSRAQASSNVQIIDLSKSDTFGKEDFSDSAHLNRIGSQKFQKLVLEKMAEKAIRPTSK